MLVLVLGLGGGVRVRFLIGPSTQLDLKNTINIQSIEISSKL